MKKVTRQATEEEIEEYKKAGEEEKQPQQVQLNLFQKPAVRLLEGQLTDPMMVELNKYIDSVREESKDYSQNLVGQIKQSERSQQLSMDMEAPAIKGLISMISFAGRKFLSNYSDQLGIKIGDEEKNDFTTAPINCHSIWTVHSYEGDYNPLHDHDVSYDQKAMAFSIILYCLVPPQIANMDTEVGLHSNGGATDGCTQFVWGTNTAADFLTLRPREDLWVVPKVGKFLMFPSWLKHQVSPFFGEGERRTLSANFRVPFITANRSTP